MAVHLQGTALPQPHYTFQALQSSSFACPPLLAQVLQVWPAVWNLVAPTHPALSFMQALLYNLLDPEKNENVEFCSKFFRITWHSKDTKCALCSGAQLDGPAWTHLKPALILDLAPSSRTFLFGGGASANPLECFSGSTFSVIFPWATPAPQGLLSVHSSPTWRRPHSLHLSLTDLPLFSYCDWWKRGFSVWSPGAWNRV